MAKQYVMINDIIEEHNARMYNLRKYYPFFVLSETAFTQYKDGRYNSLDMGYITMAVLRFFIEENNFNERDITYPQCEAFIKELLFLLPVLCALFSVFLKKSRTHNMPVIFQYLFAHHLF